MESITLLLILITLFLGAIIGALILYRQTNFWEQKGIPYLKPLIPVLGSMSIILFRRSSFYDGLNFLYNKFPNAKYYGMMILHTPLLLVRDPDLIKEICVKNFENFVDRRSFMTEEMDPVYGKNVFSLKGDRWKKMRNTLSPAYTAAKMKLMFELVEKCARDFVQYFIDHSNEAKSIELSDAFTRYCNDVIATAAFGISVNSLKDRENEFYKRGKKSFNLGSSKRFIKIIAFRLFPKLMHLLGITFLAKKSDRFFKKIITETVITRDEKNIIRPDMIHLLMEARNKDDNDLSMDDIIAQGFLFFLAGFDSSSGLMKFMAHELAMNPEIQDRLRIEVDSLLKENENIDDFYGRLSELKYMDMVLSETLRKYPPNPLLDRLCVKEYNFPKATADSKEYTVKPKNAIWIPIYGLHHDPKYFPNPEKFDPERFSDENKDKIHPYAYLPFGLGPRKCIGNRFALMETKLIFVFILLNFTLEPTEKTKYPIEFARGGGGLKVKDGLWIAFKKRVFDHQQESVL